MTYSRLLLPRGVLSLLILLLAACEGGAIRSPDLPFPELQGFAVDCTPDTPLPAGATAQCAVSDCVFRQVQGDGSTREVPGACPAAGWSATPGNVATINGDGLLTAVGAGTATVVATIDGVTASTPVTVYVPTLVGATIVCTPVAINAGQTSQCSANSCRFEVPDGNGGTREENGTCPAATWSTTPAQVGSINGSGVFTGVSAGTATVTGHVGNQNPTTQIQVRAACISSLQITPSTATVIAGQTQTYVAIATFDNNSTGNVTATTTFSSSGSAASFPAGPGNATASTDGQLATAATVTVTGIVSTANTCGNAAVSDTAMLTVQPAQLVANGLCLEPADTGTGSFEGCRADSGIACATTPLTLTVDQQRQLRLRARFNNGQECNVTNSAGSNFSSAAPAIASVTNAKPPGRGLVTAVSPGTTRIEASALIGSTPVNAAPLPITVRLDEMLGGNSLIVSAKAASASAPPRKFACVGANDLVGGLADSSQLQGQQKLFAGARFCTPEQFDETTGNCRTFIDDPAQPPRDVTNDDGVPSPTNPLANRIAWTQATGFWNGAACATTLPELPVGDGPSALVGDQLTPADRYAIGDRRPGENGVAVAAGNLRLGFSCITADYHNPAFAANHDVDGMTLLVLPVTNDVLLGPSTAQEATELCDALAPLFQLGASQNGGDGAVTQLLSVVTEIVNPILQGLAGGQEPGNTGPIPVDLLVTQILTGISDPITRQLFTAGLGNLVAAIDGGVYAPLTCGIGALLTALTTADPDAILNAQACVPTDPTFPFPAP